MNWLVRTGLNPWSEEILTHAQWNLVYAAIGFGVVFMLAHTLYVAFWPKPAGGHTAPVNPAAGRARAREGEAPFACRSRVPLDHGGVDADAARHLVRRPSSDGVRLGADSLDGGHRV